MNFCLQHSEQYYIPLRVTQIVTEKVIFQGAKK